MQFRPVINMEEFIGKTVARRLPQSGGDPESTPGQIMAGQKRGISPRGVFRFRTHEEADAWMAKYAGHLADSWKRTLTHVE
jgi:hypothetical protein